jgi:hypothetical protein
LETEGLMAAAAGEEALVLRGPGATWLGRAGFLVVVEAQEVVAVQPGRAMIRIIAANWLCMQRRWSRIRGGPCQV